MIPNIFNSMSPLCFQKFGGALHLEWVTSGFREAMKIPGAYRKPVLKSLFPASQALITGPGFISIPSQTSP